MVALLVLAFAVSCGLEADGLPFNNTGGSRQTSSSSGSNTSSSASSAASTGSSSGTGSSGSSGGTMVTWHSWDAKTDPMKPTKMFVPDTNGGNPAPLALYESNAMNSVGESVTLSFFMPGQHPGPGD